MAFIEKTVVRTTTWFLRLFQNFFAVILIGVCGYMLHQFSQFNFRPPAEVVIPMLFSCIALLVSFLSLIAICCLPYTLQILAGVLDFAILSGYIASAVLLAENFHVRSERNPLRNTLIYMRTSNGESDRENRTEALVKLLDAAVVIMIFFFFFTTLLSCWLATLSMQEHYERAEVVDMEEAR